MARNLNNRQRLALSILQWHGGGGKPSYAVGSNWFANKKVPADVIKACISEFEDVLVYLKTSKYSTPAESRELTEIIAKIKRQQRRDDNAKSL